MKLYCVGIGPGEESQITPKAMKALREADAVVGYGVYINLIKNLIHGKEIIVTPMKKEAERCAAAVELALKGKTVAVVSGGDPGIYGMAGLLMETVEKYKAADIFVEVIPGVTAATAAAAVLGAPLTHDFAVISLSDLLTPWEDIEARLKAATSAGFVICLYNPSSKKRAGYLKKACLIVSLYLEGSTPCGLVRNIGREGENSKILTLDELRETETDMFSTVIIGSGKTRIIGGKLVTPRGYGGFDNDR